MKHFLLIIISVILLLTIPSCTQFESNNKIRYIAVKMSDTKESWSIIDTEDGSIIADGDYSNKPSVVVDGIFCVQNEKGEYEFYNVNDINHVIGDTYIEATYFNDGRAVVCKNGEGLALINNEGDIVANLSSSIKMASAFENGFALVQDENGKFGYINTDGEIVIKMSYDMADPFSKDGYAVVGINDNNVNQTINYKVIDKNGITLFSFNSEKYEKPMSGFFDGSIAVQCNEDVVYLDETGSKILKVGNNQPSEYGFYDDITIYADGDLYGIKDKKGDVIIKAKYDEIKPIKNENFIIKKEDMFWIIDKESKQITNDKYIDLVIVNENRFLALNRAGGKYSLIDETGKEIGKDNFCDFSLEKDPTIMISSDESSANGIITQRANNVIEKYEELEDIHVSKCFSYISTGINTASDISIEVKFKCAPIQFNGCPRIIATHNNWNDINTMAIDYQESTLYCKFLGDDFWTTTNIKWDPTQQHIAYLSSTEFKYDNQLLATHEQTNISEGEEYLIFQGQMPSSVEYDFEQGYYFIYYVKIWKNGKLIRDFIPVLRLSDNVAGLYDKVNKSFYSSATDTQFEYTRIERP